MARYVRLSLLAVAVILMASCGRKAGIEGVIADAPSDSIVVKLLNVNKFDVLDTVALDETGRFVYKIDVKKGQPEFVYLFHGDVKVASLILQSGDKVFVKTDMSGNYDVTGSEESAKLAQVEKEYAAVISRMTALASELEGLTDEKKMMELRQEIGQEYISYYRSRVRYLMENSHSLSVIPVLYQSVGGNVPVFGQSTDAIHFKSMADSLALVYPESRFVKALRKEAEKRLGYLELESRINSAREISFPEIELPDLQAVKHKLTDVDAKVVLVQFWTATDAAQKMFNLDVLKPVYEEFHDQGFEIYQVALDVDKGLWARVVKEQSLPWINVCDSRGPASPYAAAYNIPGLPASFVIADGELVDGSAVDEKSFRKLVRRLLK